jgi:hypothetical protein
MSSNMADQVDAEAFKRLYPALYYKKFIEQSGEILGICGNGKRIRSAEAALPPRHAMQSVQTAGPWAGPGPPASASTS